MVQKNCMPKNQYNYKLFSNKKNIKYANIQVLDSLHHENEPIIQIKKIQILEVPKPNNHKIIYTYVN